MVMQTSRAAVIAGLVASTAILASCAVVDGPSKLWLTAFTGQDDGHTWSRIVESMHHHAESAITGHPVELHGQIFSAKAPVFPDPVYNHQDYGEPQPEMVTFSIQGHLSYASLGYIARTDNELRVAIDPSGPTTRIPILEGNHNLLFISTDKGLRLCHAASKPLCHQLSGKSGPYDVKIRIEPKLTITHTQLWDRGELAMWTHFRHSGTKPNGIQALQWEAASKYALRTQIALSVLAYRCGKPTYIDRDDCTPDKASRARRRIRALADGLAQWPAWRPQSQRAPEDHRWLSGSWSNGYLPMAVGLACMYLPDDCSADTAHLWQQAVRNKGLAWVTSESFPPTPHWLQRSTNHGSLILSGAAAADLMVHGCQRSKFTQVLQDQYYDLTLSAVTDQQYLEGARYLHVFVSDSLYFPWLRAACAQSTLRQWFLEADRWPSGLSDFTQILTASGGNIVGEFGDGGWSIEQPTRWSNTLASLIGINDANSNTVSSHFFDSFFVPGAGQIRDDSQQYCIALPGYAGGRATINDATVTIAMTSSDLHLTHNDQHDINSLSIAVNGHRVLLENHNAPRNALYAHNGIFFKNDTLHDPADPYSTCGVRDCRGRIANGSIVWSRQDNEGCSFAGQVFGHYIGESPANSNLKLYRRVVHLGNRRIPFILVIDHVKEKSKGSGETPMWSNYNLKTSTAMPQSNISIISENSKTVRVDRGEITQLLTGFDRPQSANNRVKLDLLRLIPPSTEQNIEVLRLRDERRIVSWVATVDGSEYEIYYYPRRKDGDFLEVIPR